jgi:hypothetical protein
VLEGKEGGPVSRPLKSGVATFPNLVVTRTTAEKEGGARNVEDQHVIRLMYTMLFRDESGRLVQVGPIPHLIWMPRGLIQRLAIRRPSPLPLSFLHTLPSAGTSHLRTDLRPRGQNPPHVTHAYSGNWQY